MSSATTPFPYGDWVRARTELLEALEGSCFYAVLLGASGMGKTCLFRDLEARLDRRRHHAVYLASSRASVTGIVRLLAHHLHLRPRRSYLETLFALTQTLAVHGARIVLWLDEAEQLDLATLERLRTLVEADPAAPSFSVVLSGGPELGGRLDSPRLLALARRITPRCTLAGLRRDELDGFLVHRFGAAAAARLPTSIRDELFERTSATPALLDRVVRRLLARHPQGAIDDDEVRASLDTASL